MWASVPKRPQGSDLCQDNEGVLVGRGLPVCAGDTCELADTTLVVGWEEDANAYILCHIQNHFFFLLIKLE